MKKYLVFYYQVKRLLGFASLSPSPPFSEQFSYPPPPPPHSSSIIRQVRAPTSLTTNSHLNNHLHTFRTHCGVPLITSIVALTLCKPYVDIK